MVPINQTAATPPWDAVTPPTAQLAVTAVTASLVALTLAFTLVMWRKCGTPLYLFILLGGSLAIFNEPRLDLISQIYLPWRDSWTVFEAYGRTIPVWALMSYTLYFGALTLAAVELLRNGATRTTFWLVVAGVWVFLLRRPAAAARAVPRGGWCSTTSAWSWPPP